MFKKIAAGFAALATSATLTIGGISMADASTHYSRDDYGPNPHASNTTHSSWGSAEWPNCPTDISNVNYSDLSYVTVRTDLVPLVHALLEKTEQMGYDLKGNASWGFNCRAIRGSDSIPSNHSRGLAVDINSDENPMGSEFVSTIPPEVVHMWESAGFYWGGRYTGRPDAMHFEYIGSVDQVPVFTEQVTGGDSEPAPEPEPTNPTKGGGPVPADTSWCYVGPAETIWKGAQNGSVKDAQCLLNIAGYNAGSIDGVFGAQTKQAVEQFQADQGLEVDGVVGTNTWKALGHQG
ncbi:peptidoglycan-binding protein [Propioniferax innocua]|uniref:D-alanyl-D-alanine carboxypeptidase-like protein n=1 Tax=Propioniferax innocua TaxID=1753 RepID=A0A542ZRG4_9ACTN|nr:peptidoglycan-binding protein [Propioniferax innocua]TQL62886.1 D-alanyl-D-alanine carboxypeptidase-like protein [Propioniferax innocua]